MKKTLVIPADAAPGRLDKYLGQELDLSRARLKTLFDEGKVRQDGHRASKGEALIPGASVEVELPDGTSELTADAGCPLSVLYEDDWILALDKPAGVPVHPLSFSDTGTLAQALIARFPECAAASPDAPLECGIAHRLDTETSGVVLAGRTPEAYRRLREMFSGGAVEKHYTALTGGLPGPEGELRIPVAHHPSDPKRMVACADESAALAMKARPAVTRWKAKAWLGDFALLDVEIPTGVRHQIRVHLAAMGAPIAGDALYGGDMLPGLARQFLHASKAAFAHPRKVVRVEVTSPLPEDLRRVLEELPGGRALAGSL